MIFRHYFISLHYPKLYIFKRFVAIKIVSLYLRCFPGIAYKSSLKPVFVKLHGTSMQLDICGLCWACLWLRKKRKRSIDLWTGFSYAYLDKTRKKTWITMYENGQILIVLVFLFRNGLWVKEFSITVVGNWVMDTRDTWKKKCFILVSLLLVHEITWI